MSGPRLSILPADAAVDPVLSAPAYRLLGLLAAHADKDGYCYPSVARLTQKLGLGERWVQRLLRDLVATPYLEATMRPGRTTIYQVITRGVASQTTGPSDHRSLGPPGGGLSDHPAVVPQTTHNDTPKDKPNDTDGAFEKFWKTYPSRGDNNPKKPARAKFLAAVKKGVDPAIIINGAANFASAEQANGTERRYIPMAITWLNQARWEAFQEAPSIGIREADPQPRSMNAI